ncbi:MAG: phosphate/phosphite/phosphonate ABC transporter substrate-binding protein [bacterium]|nr:phosphate/phosphite/phosphonate ABC transporter substrate-binding protein [bacterium]
MKINKYFPLVFTIIFCGIITSSGLTAGEIKKFKKGDKFTIALIPERNIFEQRKRYKYITDYLSKHLGLDVRAEVLSNYGKICDVFLNNEVDAGFFGSFSYVLTRAQTNIIPIARPVELDGTSTYTGYIFVRKDSGIKSAKDMKDKVLALVSRATTAGYIFQLDYFQKNGIKDMEKYLSKIYFAGSHDAAAWSVYTGEADIGGCKNHIFNELCKKNPDFKNNMVILEESVQVPSNGIAVRADIDPDLQKRLKDLLLNLDKDQEGKELLKKFAVIKFIETSDKDYDALYKMVDRLNINLKTYPYHD